MMWPAIYGALAVVAAIAVWKDPDLRLIGFALIGSWAASNLAGLIFAPAERPAVYTVVEVAVGMFAFFAWIGGKSRLLVWLLAVTAISIAANVAFAMIDGPAREQAQVWQVATNLCFGAECILTLAIGILERASGGFGKRPADIRLAHPPGAAARERGADR